MEPNNRRRPADETVDTRDFLRIASVSTALGFGCVGAAVASLRADPAGFSFQITAWTWLAFAAGAALGLSCWWLAARGRRAGRFGFILLTIVGIAAFLSPLRFIQHDKLIEILSGLAVAATVVSCGGYLIWRVSSSLAREAARTEDKSPLDK